MKVLAVGGMVSKIRRTAELRQGIPMKQTIADMLEYWRKM